MEKFYPEISSSANFAEISKIILDFWTRDNVFEKSVENRPKKIANKDNEFIFFDGPPFANGLPHYGHLLTGFVKDVVARYQTIKGKRVERKFGWDCHGLPAEMVAEKELGISGKQQIEEYGVGKFNDYCKTSVLKYTQEWQDYITKQARWVDFKNSYKTMDLNYMESVLWSFKKLYEKGLIYESLRVMPYSWACQTPLSNFETRMDNSYRSVSDKAVTVKFELKEVPKNLQANFAKCYLLAWTTTPWTLPSNLALAVGNDIEYVCVPIGEKECVIFAASSLKKYINEFGLAEEELNKYHKIKGKDLVGFEYIPLFNYFAKRQNAFRILKADFVEEGDGTGIVHIAPGFGEDDHILCEQHGIKLVCPVDAGGKFTEEVPDFVGLQVFEANDKVIIKLKKQNSWVKTEQIIHNYPHCWRTDTPLIYRAVSSWYVKVTDIKEQLIANNKKINWIPKHIRDGLFGKWLEGARDWAISRNRFWGTPIPIWQSDNPKYPRVDVYGSIAEIEKDFDVKIKDLHKQFLDPLVRPNPDDPTGKSMMRRIPDVFDCWFESGSMPYAQLHYPFENVERFEQHTSADFIVEYVAQTRGWFYTLMVLSTALFDKPAFLNCICHGVILDENGQKLSKRLQNYVDPMDIFDSVGSDALRFLMCSSSVMRGNELLIDKDGKMVNEVIRQVLNPIWNAYHFFTLYANADGIKGKLVSSSSNLNDQYILSKLRNVTEEIDKSLSVYDLPTACDAIRSFFDVLNNWYIRRNRARFWKSEHDEDKQLAYNTLYTVLRNICISASPVLPVILEYIYAGLENNGNLSGDSSVHLEDYPDLKDVVCDSNLVQDIDKIREICTTALNLRNSQNIRIRQPLKTLTVIGKNLDYLKKYFDLIKDEVNVKEILFASEVEKFASYVLKVNFQVIGKKMPEKVKDIIASVKKGEWSKLAHDKIKIAGEELSGEDFSLNLQPLSDHKLVKVLDSGDVIIMLDPKIDEDLELEGLARDLVRGIQQARKKADLHISDRININLDLETNSKILKACEKFKDYICSQTLVAQISYDKILNNDFFKDKFRVEDSDITITIVTL
ncbi:MAG: isoleucine--tRNA ligase [Rickettsiales bacterium]|nr:isoleucine--tRNA ligase [Rickettsiales bacterium]